MPGRIEKHTHIAKYSIRSENNGKISNHHFSNEITEIKKKNKLRKLKQLSNMTA